MSIAGKNTAWKHGTNAAPTVLTDYTTNMTQVNMTLNGEEVDATTFGTTGFRDYEQSFKSGTFATVYEYTDAIWTALYTLFANGTEVDFQYSPDGTANGKPKLEGDMIATSFDDGNSVGQFKTISVNWRIVDTPSPGTHS